MAEGNTYKKVYTGHLDVRGKKLDVWPDDLDVVMVVESPTVFHTQFSDMEKYHDKLKERILELEKDEDFTHRMQIGGSKVGHVHEWGTAEAELLNARATAFFCQAVGREDAIIQLSWANISRKHEYLSAHSHDHCLASVVYMLEPGNASDEKELDGRFAIVDPRVSGCCTSEEERVTMEVSPEMKAGSMILFPSELVHHVHPYTGDEPRITIAWNFSIPE